MRYFLNLLNYILVQISDLRNSLNVVNSISEEASDFTIFFSSLLLL